MSDASQLSTMPFLAELVSHVGRQGEAVERLSKAAESIARDISSLLASRVSAALVRPWANDPRIVRVVLIQSDDDERRLREAVQRYEAQECSDPMEEWLKKEGFRVVETREITPPRKGLATFKAAADKHRELQTSMEPAAEPMLEHLELEHKD